VEVYKKVKEEDMETTRHISLDMRFKQNCTAKQRKALQRVIRSAQLISGAAFPSLQDVTPPGSSGEHTAPSGKDPPPPAQTLLAPETDKQFPRCIVLGMEI